MNFVILSYPCVFLNAAVTGSLNSAGFVRRLYCLNEISFCSQVWERMAYSGMLSPENSSSILVEVLISRILALDKAWTGRRRFRVKRCFLCSSSLALLPFIRKHRQHGAWSRGV